MKHPRNLGHYEKTKTKNNRNTGRKIPGQRKYFQNTHTERKGERQGERERERERERENNKITCINGYWSLISLNISTLNSPNKKTKTKTTPQYQGQTSP